LRPGKYTGIVIFDHWGACHLYSGVYVLEISVHDPGMEDLGVWLRLAWKVTARHRKIRRAFKNFYKRIPLCKSL
jgi:hypothetical protein